MESENVSDNIMNSEAWEKCLKTISELPPKWKSTFVWFINNFEFAVKICEASNLTETEMNFLREKAIEADDTVLELLLTLKSVLNKSGENSETIVQ